MIHYTDTDTDTDTDTETDTDTDTDTNTDTDGEHIQVQLGKQIPTVRVLCWDIFFVNDCCGIIDE